LACMVEEPYRMINAEVRIQNAEVMQK